MIECASYLRLLARYFQSPHASKQTMKQARRMWGEWCTPAQLNNVESRINMHAATPSPLLTTCKEVEKVTCRCPCTKMHTSSEGETPLKACPASCTLPCGNQHIQNIAAHVPAFLLSMLMRGVNDCSPDFRQLAMSTAKATVRKAYSKQCTSKSDSVSVHYASA